MTFIMFISMRSRHHLNCDSTGSLGSDSRREHFSKKLRMLGTLCKRHKQLKAGGCFFFVKKCEVCSSCSMSL